MQFCKLISICSVLILALGCMAVKNSSSDIVSSEKVVTVVIGAKDAHSVAMIPGIASSGEFKPNREGFAANIRPENGYIVTQLSEKTVGVLYAITQVQIRAGGVSFGDCEWKQALTFEGNGGKVIYLGDFDFSTHGKQLTFEQSNNIENARSFIDSNYPKLRGRIEYVEPKLMPLTRTDCDNRRSYDYHIIYLPR